MVRHAIVQFGAVIGLTWPVIERSSEGHYYTQLQSGRVKKLLVITRNMKQFDWRKIPN